MSRDAYKPHQRENLSETQLKRAPVGLLDALERTGRLGEKGIDSSPGGGTRLTLSLLYSVPYIPFPTNLAGRFLFFFCACNLKHIILPICYNLLNMGRTLPTSWEA